jgi:phospholipid transport system substrate-binding protein
VCGALMIGYSLSLVSTVATLLAVLGLAGQLGSVRAAEDPTAFVAEVGGRFVELLTAPLPPEEREARARLLVEQAFDIPAVAQAIVGPYWKSASDVQRSEFAALFTAYLVRTYASALADHGEMRLTAVSLQAREDAGLVIGSRIVHGGYGPSPRVDWRVATVDGGHKLVDVSVDGISMVRTQRHQIGGLLYRADGNLEVVLRLLRQKVRRG